MIYLLLPITIIWLWYGFRSLSIMLPMLAAILSQVELVPWLGWSHVVLFVLGNLTVISCWAMSVLYAPFVIAMMVAGGPIALLAYHNTNAKWDREQAAKA